MSQTLPLERRIVLVRGIVQGVGFRPFIYALARRHELMGAVWNDAQGVRIEAEGDPARLDTFLRDITALAPPLARIDELTWQYSSVRGDSEFRIELSRAGAQ